MYCVGQRESLFRGCVGLLGLERLARRALPASGQPWQALPQYSNDAPDQHQILHPQRSSPAPPETTSMTGQSGVQFQPLPSAHAGCQPKSVCCSKDGCSYFPVTVFVSWFWQVTSSACYYLPRNTHTQHFRHFSLFFSLTRSASVTSFTLERSS